MIKIKYPETSENALMQKEGANFVLAMRLLRHAIKNRSDPSPEKLRNRVIASEESKDNVRGLAAKHCHQKAASFPKRTTHREDLCFSFEPFDHIAASGGHQRLVHRSAEVETLALNKPERSSVMALNWVTYGTYKMTCVPCCRH